MFATLWTEGVRNSRSGGGDDSYRSDDTFVSEIIYNERVHSKIRRFVVVREGDRSVSCLPVTSYDGYGHRKSGIRLQDHGFIYSKNSPKRVEGMCSKSLRVVLSRGALHFKDPSLVNYGNIYTAEANIKAKDIGDLDADSKLHLTRYFRRVFVGDSGVDDTPRQSSAYSGGAAYNLDPPSEYNTTPLSPGYPPPSPYSPSTRQDRTGGYSPTTHAQSYPVGYPTTQDSRQASYGSMYQPASAGTWNTASSEMQMPRANHTSQPGPAYSAANIGVGYASAPAYGSTPTGATGYNTIPNYNSSTLAYSSSDPRYSNVPRSSISQYGAISYSTPRD